MKKLFRIAFSIAFGLVLLEGLLRFFWLVPVTAKGAYFRRDDVADHSHYPYGDGRMVTNEFDVILHMNNIGMRDDDIAIPKPSGTKRILVLGDSFMEGWGVERGPIFTDALERILQQHDPAVEVVAAGTASWSTLTELAWLRRHGLALEPDAVIVALDCTDPAGDSFYAHRLLRDEKGRPERLRWPERRFDLPRPLHDALGAFYTYRYIDRFLTKKFPRTPWDYGYWGEGDDVWAPARPESQVNAEKYESYWHHTKEGFAAFKEILDEEATPWLVFQYPTGAETDTDAWMPGRFTADFDSGVTSPRRFAYFAAFTDENSIPYYSLLNDFRSHPDPKSLFYPGDGHWSASGHEFAAERIAAELIRRRIVF